MTRKSAVKKKAAVRKFKNGTKEWADHQNQLLNAAELAERQQWEAGVEKSKQKFSPSAAEKYLNGGMDVLEHFAGLVMFAGPSGPCGLSSKIEEFGFEDLGRLIARHTDRCLRLLCKAAQHGEKNAARNVFDASVGLARVIYWIVQNRPECLPEMKDQSLLPHLLAWAKAGEIARGSVLKLEQRTKLQPATPATRLVLNFMRTALGLRLEINRASKVFNQVGGHETLEHYLVDKCRFLPEQLVFKDLPDFTPKTARDWWQKALKPYLDKPETLHNLRWYNPSVFENLTKAAKSGEDGSAKDYKIKDELKKRCRAALIRLASAISQ